MLLEIFLYIVFEVYCYNCTAGLGESPSTTGNGATGRDALRVPAARARDHLAAHAAREQAVRHGGYTRIQIHTHTHTHGDTFTLMHALTHAIIINYFLYINYINKKLQRNVQVLAYELISAIFIHKHIYSYALANLRLTMCSRTRVFLNTLHTQIKC